MYRCFIPIFRQKHLNHDFQKQHCCFGAHEASSRNSNCDIMVSSLRYLNVKHETCKFIFLLNEFLSCCSWTMSITKIAYMLVYLSMLLVASPFVLPVYLSCALPFMFPTHLGRFQMTRTPHMTENLYYWISNPEFYGSNRCRFTQYVPSYMIYNWFIMFKFTHKCPHCLILRSFLGIHRVTCTIWQSNMAMEKNKFGFRVFPAMKETHRRVPTSEASWRTRHYLAWTNAACTFRVMPRQSCKNHCSYVCKQGIW